MAAPPDVFVNLDATPAPGATPATPATHATPDATPATPATPDNTHSNVDPPHAHLYTLAYLVLFSFPGTLARVGLQALTDYPGAPVRVASLWPNFGGCLILGFLAADRVLFRPPAHAEKNTAAAHLAAKKTIPLYIGLTTGFCGSFTTFSAFVRDLFLAISNDLPSNSPPRHAADSLMAVLAVLLLTLLLSLGGFVLGTHLALLLESVPAPPWLRTIWPRSRPHSRVRLRRTTDRLAVGLAVGCWLGAVLLAALPPDRHHGNTWRGKITLALVFSPPGTLARYYLARGLNPRRAAFPLGTFAANIAGALLAGLFWDLAHVPLGGAVACQLLQGLEDGFCGCLTTVSTWVAELAALRRRHAYIYGAASVLAALAIAVLVMGGLRWTHGFAPLQCVT